MFDVVVIGGNLAGATAANNAAERGVSVALVERHKKPFFPAHCGEAMPDTWTRLIDLDKIGCPKNKIKNFIFNVSSPREYHITLKKPRSYIFDRNYVENYLLKQAEKKGVELKLGICMRDFKPPHEILLDNNKIIEGKIIIDASGIACQVGRRIGMATKLKPEDIGVCIQSRVQCNFKQDTMKIWFHKPYAQFGYAWFFPVNNKEANIGLGVFGGQKLDLAKLLDKYIKDMTGGKNKITHTFRACVPISPPMSKVIKDNVMIVGDAARLVHSNFGYGIGNALYSGRSAGMTAAKYIKGEISSLEPYQDSMKSGIIRLQRAYKRKKRIATEKKFVNSYRRIFFIFSVINKIVPNFIQNYLSDNIIGRI